MRKKKKIVPIKKRTLSLDNELRNLVYVARCVKKLKHMTAKYLADKIEMPLSTFMKYIWYGSQLPTKKERQIICKELKCDQQRIWPDIDFENLEEEE